MLPRTNSNVAWILGAFVVGLLVFGNEDTYGQDAEPRGSESLRSSDPVSIESFESRIRPLLVERCFECHSEGSDASGGLVLDSLEGMLRGGDSGPAINLDQPEESLVLRAIRYRDPKLQMPPDSKLSDAQVEQLREWIVSGAPVPTTFAKGADHPTVSTALTVDRAREHWAYRPIERPDIPDVSRVGPEEDRPESPIDAFLVRVQQRMDVSPSDRVDLGTWLRRLTIDLHGLNPTFEDLRYWLDLETTRDGPERMMLREQVVDSMLASPRYGERMARRWMDGVRYAESLTLRGFVMGDAWRYRAYLIDAFDSDMPFDQFIAEQIAGDLMPQASVRDAQRKWSATTGLVLGDHNYEEQDKLQLEMDIVDEQLETIGKVFLAQTLGCARCHDHKFDPIPTSDYYAMAGILKSSVSVEHENVSKWIRMPLPLEPEIEQSYGEARLKMKKLEQEIATIRKQWESEPRGARVAKRSEFPGVVVDDQQARKIGNWKPSSSVKAYVDVGYLHDGNEGRGEKTVTFEPPALAPGSYALRIAYAHGENRSTKTLVRIASADGETEVRINQKQPPADDGLWHALGTFRFEAGGQAYVVVSNDGSDGHVIADAIQFLPAGQFLPEGPSPPSRASLSADEQAAQDAQRAAALQEKERMERELKELTKFLDTRPMVQSLKAAEKPTDLPIHVRGSVHRLGSVVPRGFLGCINTHNPGLLDRSAVPPQSNGRLELARWLVDEDNPLPRRVAVNRLWSYLMGSGIVRSLDNFGTTGDSPTDPELLDWLASEFYESDWSTKKMLHAIALSAAYQRSAYRSASSQQRDPDNLAFAASPLRRLDAEALRDSILQASGELQLLTRLESTIRSGIKDDYRYEHEGGLRAVYQPWFRNSSPQLIRQFDGANPSYPTFQRDRSTIATQALTLMHSPWVAARAKATAERAGASASEQESLAYVFRSTLGRDPDRLESEWALEVLREEGLPALVLHLFSSIDFRYAP
ncbi:MAG: DUF1553 domain-containing protein [Planctomycetota bacterium]